MDCIGISFTQRSQTRDHGKCLGDNTVTADLSGNYSLCLMNTVKLLMKNKSIKLRFVVNSYTIEYNTRSVIQ